MMSPGYRNLSVVSHQPIQHKEHSRERTGRERPLHPLLQNETRRMQIELPRRRTLG